MLASPLILVSLVESFHQEFSRREFFSDVFDSAQSGSIEHVLIVPNGYAYVKCRQTRKNPTVCSPVGWSIDALSSLSAQLVRQPQKPDGRTREPGWCGGGF